MLVGNKNDEAAELREVSHAEGKYLLINQLKYDSCLFIYIYIFN